jgi:hypothetical protein
MFVLLVLACATLVILVQFVSDTALMFSQMYRRYVHGQANATPDRYDAIAVAKVK